MMEAYLANQKLSRLIVIRGNWASTVISLISVTDLSWLVNCSLKVGLALLLNTLSLSKHKNGRKKGVHHIIVMHPRFLVQLKFE